MHVLQPLLFPTKEGVPKINSALQREGLERFVTYSYICKDNACKISSKHVSSFPKPNFRAQNSYDEKPKMNLQSYKALT